MSEKPLWKLAEPDHRPDCPVRVERNAALAWMDAHAASVRAAQRAEERADAPPLVRAAAERRAVEAADAERGAASLLVAPSYDLGGGWRIETTEAARERVARIRSCRRPNLAVLLRESGAPPLVGAP